MLSIIIISKNEEKCLPRLLESIKNQTYKDYEIILSDANSTDNTRKIAKKYGCKIVDGGLPSVGRNNGAKSAKGKLLLFLDSDIELPKDFIEKSIMEIKIRNAGCGAPLNNLLSNNLIDKFLISFYNNWIKLMENIFPQAGGSCIFCEKKFFNKINGFDEGILFAEDADFVKRISKITKFIIFRNLSCNVDSRIITKEGRIKLIYKNLLGAGYRTFFGEVRKPFFSYKLNGGVDIKKIQSNK